MREEGADHWNVSGGALNTRLGRGLAALVARREGSFDDLEEKGE